MGRSSLASPVSTSVDASLLERFSRTSLAVGLRRFRPSSAHPTMQTPSGAAWGQRQPHK